MVKFEDDIVPAYDFIGESVAFPRVFGFPELRYDLVRFHAFFAFQYQCSSCPFL